MKYKLKEIKTDIFAVFVNDKYDRAMLFCRAQEFYESPRKEFRNSKFSMWDYFRWYSRKNGCFSYPRDFTGFNFPLVVAKKCYELNECETPYDRIMKEIVEKVFVNGKRQYLIGVDQTDKETLEHELAHGLYYTDVSYREAMDAITEALPKNAISRMKKNLKDKGYCREVAKDEIQAYFAAEEDPVISKGVRGKKRIHKQYRAIFKQYETR